MTDPRVLRNRAALRTALLEALADTPFEKISIRALAASAEISYTTFFRHYDGKEALLGELAVEEVRQLHALTIPVYRDAEPLEACEAVFRHVESRKSIWAALIAGAPGFTRDEMLRQGHASTTRLKRSRLPDNLGVILGVSALIEILGWWIKSGHDASEGARIYYDVAVHPITAFLPR